MYNKEKIVKPLKPSTMKQILFVIAAAAIVTACGSKSSSTAEPTTTDSTAVCDSSMVCDSIPADTLLTDTVSK